MMKFKATVRLTSVCSVVVVGNWDYVQYSDVS